MRYAVLLCLLVACDNPAPPVAAAAPSPAPAPPPRPVLDVQAQVAKVRGVAKGHASESFRVLDLVYARLDDHFAARLARVDRVTGELFSARWKWRATFWKDADYERAVRRLFDKEFFDGIPAVLDAVARDVEAAAETADNRMMAEVAEIVRGAAPKVDLDALRADYRVELAATVVRDAEMNLVSIAAVDFVTSLVAGSLAASGVFGPAVAAGAATSWWNVGIGMVVAVAVAIIVDAIIGDTFESDARTRVYVEVSKFRMDAMRRVGGAAEAALRQYVESREEAVAKATEKSLEPFAR
jgi:hypothetical protein